MKGGARKCGLMKGGLEYSWVLTDATFLKLGDVFKFLLRKMDGGVPKNLV